MSENETLFEMGKNDTLFKPATVNGEIHFHTVHPDGSTGCLGALKPEDVDPLILALYQAKQATASGDSDE